jgi:hypothetical protein
MVADILHVGNRAGFGLRNGRYQSSLVEHTLTRPDRVLVAVDLRGLDSVEDFIDQLVSLS